MKKYTLFLALILMYIPLAKAQNTYVTSGGEFLFQFADVADHGASLNNEMRFTLFFHTGSYFNVDFNAFTGFYTGTAIRNVGYIFTEGGVTTKRRSYSLGVPVAFKLGAVKKGTYFFGGGEYEWMFHYKEKVFQDGNKTKMTEWFSSRVNPFIPSVFGGVQFKGGLNVKAKFYLDDFMNTGYRDANGDYPYSGLSTRLFYISLSWMVKTKPFHKGPAKQEASYVSR